MALDIKWQRPDQRLALTVTAPLFIEIDGKRVKADEWSLDGFNCTAAGLEWQGGGDRRKVRLTLPFQGFDMSFDATCDLARDPTDADKVTGQFIDLGTRERELIVHFIEELLRGSMVPVRDTIQRIDVPVQPTRLTPDSLPGATRSRARRSVLMSTLYGVLGIGVFGYLGVMLFVSLFRTEVQSAMISAPTEMVAAQAEGRVRWGDFKPGDAIKAGSVVVRMYDNALEREIEIAEVSIREREARLTFLRRRERNGVERLQSMPVAELRQLTRTKLDLDELRAQLDAAEAEQQRTQPASPDANAETELGVRIADLKSKIEAKEFDLRTRKDTINRNALGKKPAQGAPAGPALVGSLDDLEAQIELARQEVQFARERHTALLNQRERLVVRAPFDGRIVDLPHVDKGSIRKGDIVAVLEQAEARNVTAYLNDEEIAHVSLGDRARLYVPALRERLTARVSRIDRNFAAGRELDPQTGLMSRWRSTAGGTAKVILAFDDTRKVVDTDRFRAGTPVVVVFERGPASRRTDGLPASPQGASEPVSGLRALPNSIAASADARR